MEHAEAVGKHLMALRQEFSAIESTRAKGGGVLRDSLRIKVTPAFASVRLSKWKAWKGAARGFQDRC